MITRPIVSSLFAAAVILTSMWAAAEPLKPADGKCEKPAYPKKSVLAEEEGFTLLGIRIMSDGTVGRVVVLNSSGSAALDRAAQDAVSRCVFDIPAGKTAATGTWMPVQYSWFLRGDPRTSPVVAKLAGATDAGKPAARYHLSLIVSTYAGSDSERALASKLLHDAAAQGHAHAQFQLGRRYEKGLKVEANKEEAQRWYEKAAAQGDEFAIERLKLGEVWY